MRLEVLFWFLLIAEVITLMFSTLEFFSKIQQKENADSSMFHMLHSIVFIVILMYVLS